MTDISIPTDLWKDDAEAVLLRWLYADGAGVAEGEAVAEIMIEKVQVELPAPASGTLSQLIAEDSPVTKGQVIGQVAG